MGRNMVTEDEVRALFEKEEYLSYAGIGMTGTFAYDRQVLLSHTARNEITLCCDWLARCRKTKTANRKRTTYGLKHEVEKYYGHTVYISEGSLIAALVIMGFEYERYDGYPEISKSRFNFVYIGNRLPVRP